MSSEELSIIKIPEKVYVGFQGRRTEDEVPLGFMTPYDETAAGKKRQATVDSWAQGYGYGREKTFNSIVIDNAPMIGFKIGRAIRRSSRYSGTSTSVRIEDPRGFELEISIENLVMLMKNNIMEDCELQQECVWGREGAKNVLLPVNSEDYALYLKTQTLISNKVSLKDIKVGDVIKLLGDADSYEYMGAMFPIVKTTKYGDYHPYSGNDLEGMDIKVSERKRYIVRKRVDGKYQYTGHASLKIEKVVKATAKQLTIGDIEKMVADDLLKGGSIDLSTNEGKVLGLVGGKTVITNKVLTQIPVEESELAAAFKSGCYVHPLREHTFIIMERQGVRMVACTSSNWYYGKRTTHGSTGAQRHYTVPNSNSYSSWYNHKEKFTDGFIGYPKHNVTSMPCSYSGPLTDFPDENGVTFTRLMVDVDFSNGHKLSLPL